MEPSEADVGINPPLSLGALTRPRRTWEIRRRCDFVYGPRDRMPDASDNIPPCAGCGRCCHLVVELISGVDDDVPVGLVVEHAGTRCMEQLGDGACVALDPITRLCTIYERRPEACRRLKRAESLCRMALAR